MGNKIRQQVRRQARARRKERKKRQHIEQQKISVKQRPCNECTACCTVMAVEQISKPIGEPCPHLCRHGCEIYESRPAACQGFNCCWRYGLGNDDERPDKSGIVFDITRHSSSIPQALVAREVWPGAFEQSQAFLDRLTSNGHLIILVRGDRRTAIGPPVLVALVQKAIANHG